MVRKLFLAATLSLMLAGNAIAKPVDGIEAVSILHKAFSWSTFKADYVQTSLASNGSQSETIGTMIFDREENRASITEKRNNELSSKYLFTNNTLYTIDYDLEQVMKRTTNGSIEHDLFDLFANKNSSIFSKYDLHIKQDKEDIIYSLKPLVKSDGITFSYKITIDRSKGLKELMQFSDVGDKMLISFMVVKRDIQFNEETFELNIPDYFDVFDNG